MKKKPNVIDGIVVVLVLIVLAGGIWFITKKSGQSGGPAIITGRQMVEITAEATEVLPEVADSMRVGDKLVAQKSYQEGEITAVEIANDFEIGAKSGKIVVIDKPEFRRVTVKMTCNANRYGPYLDLGGQMLKIGEPYWIKSENSNLLGTIIGMEILEGK